MNKAVFYILIILFILVSCNIKPDRIYISGTIKDANGGKLYLEKLTSSSKVTIDSCLLNESGDFELKGYANDPAFYSLNLDHKRTITLAIHPGEKVEINSAANDMGRDYSVRGSRDSELAKDVIGKLNHMLAEIKVLGDTYNDSISSSRILEIKAHLDSTYHQLIRDYKKSTIQFIKSNPGSMAALMALYQQIPSANPMKSQNLIDPIADLELYELVDSVLMLRYPLSEPVMLLHQQTIGYRKQKKEYESICKNTAIGHAAPEIIMPSSRGDTIKLSSLRGKYVLVNFWASWSDESRNQNILLKTIYQKYRWNGFEILQVSLDKSREAWLNAIAVDKLPWKNGCDQRFWNSSAAVKYNVREIPASFIIDKEGRIIHKDFTPEKLNPIMKDIFNF